MRSLVTHVAAIAFVCVVASAGPASTTPRDEGGHRSSLRARVTMTDGIARTITLQGVGCTASLCSRVRARALERESVWLDGLASIREISHEAEGPVSAVFTFKDGSQRGVSIVEGNRVLYLEGRSGRTEKLDLARLARIDFE
jgi:hypothetical protein